MHSLRHLTLDTKVLQSRRASRAARSIGFAVLMAAAIGNATANGKTVTVTEQVELSAAPDHTWQTIKDFNAWQTWHPAFASTVIIKNQGNAKGTVRVLTAKDGAKFTEVLVSHNDASRSYQYRITESPLPITGYVSTLAIQPTPSGSKVVWSSHFEVAPGASEDEVKKAIAGVYRAGLDNLAAVVK
jgi:hypothetical protein